MWPVGTSTNCIYIVLGLVALSFLSAVLQEGIEQFLNCLRLLGPVTYKQVGLS